MKLKHKPGALSANDEYLAKSSTWQVTKVNRYHAPAVFLISCYVICLVTPSGPEGCKNNLLTDAYSFKVALSCVSLTIVIGDRIGLLVWIR